MKSIRTTLARGRTSGLALLTALLLTGCDMLPHTSQEKLEPTDEEKLDLYTTTATYLYEDGSLERAQDQAIKALEIDPDHEAMRRMVGWIRVRMGSPEDLLIARDLFEELRDEGDDNQATILGQATTYERLGLAWEQAADRVRRGEQLPDSGDDAEEAARRMESQSEELFEDSLELLESTLVEGEGSTSTMNGLQRVNALLGRYEESLAWSIRLLERSEEEIDLWDQLLQKQDLTEREETLYNENRRVGTQLQLDTRLFAATVLNDMGRTEKALEQLDAVVQLDPALPQGYSLRAELRAKLGDFAGAIEDLDRFLGLSDAPFEDPDVKRAFELRTSWEIELARS